MGVAWRILKGHTSSVNSMAFLPDSTAVASASNNGVVQLWDSAMGMSRQAFKCHTAWAFAWPSR
jgi:WD40 repeat protein